MRLLVTVGTTRFDLLIERVFQTLRTAAVREEFGDVLVQLGASAVVIPPDVQRVEEDVRAWPDLSNRVTQVTDAVGPASAAARRGARVFWFRYSKHLKDLMEDADVILSHCGAGTLLEALRTPAAVWAVNNPALLQDHQRELGEALAALDKIVFIASEALANVELFTDHVNQALESCGGAGAGDSKAVAALARKQLAALWRELLAPFLR